jgi:hypothetical protein
MVRLEAIFLGTVLIFGCGCQTDRITRLEKQNEDLKSQMAKESTARDFDLQAKCSKDAKAWFNENYSGTGRDKDTSLLSYTNHYHKASNECLIVVEYHFNQAAMQSWFNDISLWNVYENSKYGSFVEVHSTDYTKQIENRVQTCNVADQKCTTIDQFNGLVQPYMNN